MVAQRQPRTFTLEQYLELEKSSDSDTRNELIDGVIYSMTGGTPRHAQLCLRVGALLHDALRGRPCVPYSSDLHLYIPQARRGTYADVSVFCEPLAYHGDRKDIVVNPTLIVEVLSPTTEMDDRVEKFAAYKTLQSLKEYVLIAQDRPRVEVFTRQGEHAWLEREITGLEMKARLDSVDVTLALADIYEGVDLS